MQNKITLIFFSFVLVSFCNSARKLSVFKKLLKFDSSRSILRTLLCAQDKVEALREFTQTYKVVVCKNFTFTYSPVEPSYTTFLLDFDCLSAQEILLEANRNKLFGQPFKWIIIGESLETLNGLDILLDSDVTIVLNHTLKKIYKIRTTDNEFVTEALGTLNQDKISLNHFEPIVSKRRKNLNRSVLKTTIIITNNDSLNHLTDRRDIHIDSLTKVNYVLIRHLADTVNATLDISIENTWGYKNETGEWSGMMGDLVRKKTDITGTSLFVTTDRIGVIDYVAMLTHSKSKFIFRQPKLSYVSNVYILPFSFSVWLCGLTMFLILSITLFIAVKWESKRRKHNKMGSTCLEIFFECFAAICQQGTTSIPLEIPGRIILLWVLVFFMFLYTSYSANIVALLQSSSHSIRTLKDITNSRLDVGVDDTVFNRFYFPNVTEPVRRALYLQKVAPPGQKPKFYDMEQGIRKVKEGLFAFHVETGPGYKFIRETFMEDEKCGLTEIPFLQVPDPCFAVQKNSSFKEMLKVGLLRLQETGIPQREESLIYIKRPPCMSRTSRFISVGLIDCYFVATVLGGGILLAIVIFLCEIFLKRNLQLRSRNLPLNLEYLN